MIYFYSIVMCYFHFISYFQSNIIKRRKQNNVVHNLCFLTLTLKNQKRWVKPPLYMALLTFLCGISHLAGWLCPPRNLPLGCSRGGIAHLVSRVRAPCRVALPYSQPGLAHLTGWLCPTRYMGYAYSTPYGVGGVAAFLGPFANCAFKSA